MKIKDFKKILDKFDENKDIFIFDFNSNNEIDLFDLSDNNGHLQINVNIENNETLLFLRYGISEKDIYKNRLKKYLCCDNETMQECILQFDSLQAAFTYCNTYNYDNFSNYLDMIAYYDNYMFLYNNKVYMLLCDNALNVYRH